MITIDPPILDAIKNSKNVAVITHIRPDADALGSASVLKLALEQLGKTVDIYCDSEISDNYNFIKHVNKINKSTTFSYDTYISVDCADESRLGKYATKFLESDNSINIDHHITNTNFAKLNFVCEASSTGEILYYILKKLQVTITKDMAMALYSAIASDTGCFQHNNTTAKVHEIAAELMHLDIDVPTANYYLFKRRTLEQMQLKRLALKNLKFYEDNKVSLIYLREKDYKSRSIQNHDNIGLVDMCINIEKVEIGILISEIKPNLYTCSLRGKGSVDVSEIATIFGGGGHKFAAGCNIFGSCNTVINKLIRACRQSLNTIATS